MITLNNYPIKIYFEKFRRNRKRDYIFISDNRTVGRFRVQEGDTLAITQNISLNFWDILKAVIFRKELVSGKPE